VLDESQEISFQTRDGEFTHYFDRREIVTVNNCLLDLSTGRVYARFSKGEKYRLIKESTEWPQSQSIFAKSPPLKKIKRVSGKFTVALTNNGFYHNFVEDFPNAIRLGGFRNNLASYYKEPYKVEMVDLLGKGVHTSHNWVEVDALSFVSRGIDVGYLHPSNLKILREALKVELGNNSLIRNFYLSRRFSRRNLPNEQVLEEYLSNLGFEIVYAERLSLREQAKKFSQANCIISPHGAGLVNAIWSDSAKVIEIESSREINRCFEWQSLLLNQSYFRVFFEKNEKIEDLIRKIAPLVES
jgi:hypothetical protein